MNTLFDFSTFPILTTERLRLRRMRPDDADSLVALFGDPEVMRFLNDPLMDTPEKAINFVNWLDDQYSKHQSVNWAITLCDDDRLIGMCGTHDWDRYCRHVDIGYHILRAHWGQGYATEAARTIIAWCFAHLDVHRVQADCTEGNFASERVMLKCGMTFEGVWRESCWEHERFVNVRQFGLLRHEYR